LVFNTTGELEKDMATEQRHKQAIPATIKETNALSPENRREVCKLLKHYKLRSSSRKMIRLFDQSDETFISHDVVRAAIQPKGFVSKVDEIIQQLAQDCRKYGTPLEVAVKRFPPKRRLESVQNEDKSYYMTVLSSATTH